MTPNSDVRTVDLTAGPIDYVDTGGDGPTVVLLHGVLMNNTVWRGVMSELTPALRCIAPTLPLGRTASPCGRAPISVSTASLCSLLSFWSGLTSGTSPWS